MKHPVGRAIAQHTKYGPGHPTHDLHQAVAGGPTGLNSLSPTLMHTPSGPLNPVLLQQLMQAQQGGGPGATPMPMPPARPQPAPPMPAPAPAPQ